MAARDFSSGAGLPEGNPDAVFAEALPKCFDRGMNNHPAVLAMGKMPAHLLSRRYVRCSVQKIRQESPDVTAVHLGRLQHVSHFP